MRVISGFLKGKKLKGYNLQNTRPTMAKVKESIFAIIQNDIKDSICLDLFAGSGALGIEAISNGAKLVYFVDNNKDAIKIIKDNIDTLKLNNQSIIIFNDYKKALQQFKDNNVKFDLIFLDPPYEKELIEMILDYINHNQLLLESGQVICELQTGQLHGSYGDLKCIKEKKYSDKKVIIYKKVSTI